MAKGIIIGKFVGNKTKTSYPSQMDGSAIKYTYSSEKDAYETILKETKWHHNHTKFYAFTNANTSYKVADNLEEFKEHMKKSNEKVENR